jgi:hypothetical protein
VEHFGKKYETFEAEISQVEKLSQLKVKTLIPHLFRFNANLQKMQ